MLQVKKLTRKYKNGDSYINAVDEITSSFNKGELTFILGASGSGKSTLLNVLCGLDTEIEGNIEIEGINTKDFSKRDWAIYRNRYVGFIFQEYNLINHLNVWENVALPLQFQGISKKEAKAKAIAELEKIGLGKFVNKKPNQISGGQAQRVAIARALVTDPKVIMADEPTGALDTDLGHKVIQYLKSRKDERVIVVVTHDEDLAFEYADRIVELEDGKVLKDTKETTEVVQNNKKALDFEHPKMKLGMMFKFARNNITSRMFRSLATSAVVSIGYIAIFLISFLVFGLNTTINDIVNMFVPEDQYQIYNVENSEITDEQLTMLNGLDEIENVRYVVSENVAYDTRGSQTSFVTLEPVPYDTALLTKDNELFGRLPENDNEILITVGMAAKIRELTTVDEDSYEYVFNLVNGKKYEFYHIDYNDWEETEEVTIGEYTIVGMLASQALQYSANAYMDYNELLDISETIHEEVIYKDMVTAYLTIERTKDIDELKIKLRDDHDLILDSFYDSITSGIDDFMMNVLKVLIAIASITLIVSGILIGLIIYISVIERVKEIGILTAIGARQDNIVGIFLFESSMIGLLSSVIAVIISLVITQMINGLFSNFISTPLGMLTSSDISITLMTPKLWIIGSVIGFSIIYAVITGLIPSFIASRLNAVKALRRE